MYMHGRPLDTVLFETYHYANILHNILLDRFLYV